MALALYDSPQNLDPNQDKAEETEWRLDLYCLAESELNTEIKFSYRQKYYLHAWVYGLRGLSYKDLNFI